MEELWKATPYPNYEVSNLGRDRSVATGQFGHPIKEPKVHKPFSSGKGYQRAMLCIDGKQKNVSLAKLIALAFIGDAPEDKPIVTYEDGNRANCTVDNLFYASKEEVGRLTSERNYKLHGDKSKLGKDILKATKRTARLERALEVHRLMKEGKTFREVAQIVGLSESGVYRIYRGANNKMLEKANATQKE